MNKVFLKGNMTRDPELKFTPGNMAYTKFGMAMNHKWKNKEGEMQEKVTFVDCTAWGRTAEVVNEYFTKGSPILVEGRLDLEQWQDKEGQKRSKLSVIVEKFEFCGGDSKSKSPSTKPPEGRRRDPSDSDPPAVDDDNIPF